MAEKRPLGALGDLVQREFLDKMQFPPSARRMALAIGVAPTSIGNWMEGSSMPSPENLRALTDLTGLSYDRLLEAALADNGYRDLPEHVVARRGLKTRNAALEAQEAAGEGSQGEAPEGGA